MNDLLPLERYLDAVRDQSGTWRRLGWLGGGVVGLSLAAFAYWPLRALGPLGGFSTAIAAGVVAGTVFGVFFAMSMRKRMLAATVSVFEGAGRFAAPPPEGVEPRLRLPATWLRSPGIGVGGVLYLLPPDALFVPHAANGWAHRAPLEIRRSPGDAIEVVSQELSLVQRLLVAEAPSFVRLETSEGHFEFLVPAPDEVRRLVVEALDLECL